jgi:ketosteroid isomerase-like protein
MTSTASTHDLVSSFLHAMVGHDRDTLTRVLADDIVWNTPPSTMPQFRGPHRGRAAVFALIDGGGDMFTSGTQRVEISYIVAEGEIAAAQFRQIARTSTGRDYDNLYSFFFRIVDGQIHELWEHVDTGYFYALFDIDPAWVREG